ncbi:hypothetical protein F7725_015848, partial [Dissostichus mawsoni]
MTGSSGASSCWIKSSVSSVAACQRRVSGAERKKHLVISRSINIPVSFAGSDRKPQGHCGITDAHNTQSYRIKLASQPEDKKPTRMSAFRLQLQVQFCPWSDRQKEKEKKQYMTRFRKQK